MFCSFALGVVEHLIFLVSQSPSSLSLRLWMGPQSERLVDLSSSLDLSLFMPQKRQKMWGHTQQRTINRQWHLQGPSLRALNVLSIEGWWNSRFFLSHFFVFSDFCSLLLLMTRTWTLNFSDSELPGLVARLIWPSRVSIMSKFQMAKLAPAPNSRWKNNSENLSVTWSWSCNYASKQASKRC